MAGDYLAKYELFKNKFNITGAGCWVHVDHTARNEAAYRIGNAVLSYGTVCVLEAIKWSVCVAGFFCFLEKKELRVLHCPGWEGILWLYWRCIVWR